MSIEVKPKILILSDSVALPRKIARGSVAWEETYIYALRENFLSYEVINVSIGGATIRDLRNQANYYKILQPDIVVLQCGIVDASPRAFGRIDLELIKKAHLFRFTKPFVSFLRKKRSHHYTSLKDFDRCLSELRAELNAPKFISLGIIPASTEYEKKMPGITKSIERYNQILKNNSLYLSTENIPRSGICEDHHHVNGLGQEYLFNLLKAELD
jgi:hypothetical protein